MEKIKERPIIFSAPMIRAILEGTKTQTRRVVKDAPRGPGAYYLGFYKGVAGFMPDMDDETATPFRAKCPYGDNGDTLWVREVWSKAEHCLPFVQPRFEYRANFPDDPDEAMRDRHDFGLFKWETPLFMPRAVSRITLKIMTVTVERLNDITERAARAEGFEDRGAFRRYWNSLNEVRGYAWRTDPWVWVVEFERVKS